MAELLVRPTLTFAERSFSDRDTFAFARDAARLIIAQPLECAVALQPYTMVEELTARSINKEKLRAAGAGAAFLLVSVGIFENELDRHFRYDDTTTRAIHSKLDEARAFGEATDSERRVFSFKMFLHRNFMWFDATRQSAELIIE